MFNGLFNNDTCGGGNTGCGCFGGCNYTWLLLIIIFLCCCGKGNISLCINPTCLVLVVALLLCCGGMSFGKGCH